MQINKKLIKHNFVKGRKEKIKYIVIHDTGNPNKGADAENHYKYFNSKYVGASAHYFVDEKQILQVINDEDTAWHVGDGKGVYGINNNNSIGIEICINDGNYDKEVERTLELTKHLMEKHSIPIENVVRHYDASRKSCPRFMMTNNWKAWHEFKARLASMFKSTIKINILGQEINANGYFKNNTNYVTIGDKEIPVRQLGEALNLTVSWDTKNKVVVMK